MPYLLALAFLPNAQLSGLGRSPLFGSTHGIFHALGLRRLCRGVFHLMPGITRKEIRLRRAMHAYSRKRDARCIAPEHVVLDRAARLDAPRTLTARVMGDPPQGYSALDRVGQ